jgi:tetratricopeptide (TPR) repeat protein
MRRIFHGAAAVLLACLAVPAAAQDSAASWPACANEGEAYTIEARTAACTLIIQGGRETPENLALAYNNRGWAHNDRKAFALALADLDRAIRVNPRLAWAWNNRGNSYGGRGDHLRAIADYDEAIRLDPLYANAFNSRGFSRLSLRDHARARADFNEAIRLDPGLVLAWRNRARGYEAEGDLVHALADHREAVRLAPADADARADFCRLLTAATPAAEETRLVCRPARR